MSPKYTLGPDIDLDVEIVRDKTGQRITEERAQEIAASALDKSGAGRPSHTGPARRSREVKACVPIELRDRLHAAAQQRASAPPSSSVREALDRRPRATNCNQSERVRRSRRDYRSDCG
jgi:hypothetical protein